MKTETQAIFDELFIRYPQLQNCQAEIQQSFDILLDTYQNGGKVLCCGNGGSASDSEHIVGELLKKFKKHRDIPNHVKAGLAQFGEAGINLAEKLEGSLPAISLVSMCGIITAFANDVGWDEAFAQQLLGLGKAGDTLLVISTSGNSRNCVNAALLARVLGIKVIGLTGEKGGRFREVCNVAVCVPAGETYQIQEYHLPIYHALCAMLEAELF